MSRWGNFLSGIESGLDRILAEESSGQSSAPAHDKRPKVQGLTDVSRQEFTHVRTNHLQKKLSQPVASQNSTTYRKHSQDCSQPVVRQDVSQEDEAIANTCNEEESLAKKASNQAVRGSEQVQEDVMLERYINNSRLSGALGGDHQEPTQAKTLQPTLLAQSNNIDQPSESPQFQTEDRANSSDGGDRADLTNKYHEERIEELQARSDSFVEEARTQARQSRSRAGSSNNIQNQVKQQEKIAALMKEGQKLSERELKHVRTIRRLKDRVGDVESKLNQERNSTTGAHREAQNLSAIIDGAEVGRNWTSDEADLVGELQRKIIQFSEQVEAQSNQIACLSSECESLRTNGVREQADVLKQQLDRERRHVLDLKEELDNSRIERELIAGRLKAQLDEVRAKSTRELEDATSKQTELQNEIKALESRLETMRARNEEVAGSPSDQQAKQLRQIEALQRQYKLSKENWDGIEASLELRISSLEKERDDVMRKEAELRRKFRESALTIRNRDDEIEELKAIKEDTEDKLQVERDTSSELKDSLLKTQAELEQVREDLRAIRACLSVRGAATGPDERSTSHFVLNTSEQTQQSSSVTARSPAMHTGDGHSQKNASELSLFSNGISTENPPSSRKVCPASLHRSSHTAQRHHSLASVTRSSSRSATCDSQPVLAGDDGDPMYGLATPATPGRNFGDMLSASAATPAAGPSVQLVERMSAAVRRLESEKASVRDEFDRMSSERDEARRQIVTLLAEVEAKRQLEKIVLELKDEVSNTQARYQTTLELLGEKSEAVEELKADIVDMKQIYRDALQRSMS